MHPFLPNSLNNDGTTAAAAHHMGLDHMALLGMAGHPAGSASAAHMGGQGMPPGMPGMGGGGIASGMGQLSMDAKSTTRYIRSYYTPYPTATNLYLSHSFLIRHHFSDGRSFKHLDMRYC